MREFDEMNHLRETKMEPEILKLTLRFHGFLLRGEDPPEELEGALNTFWEGMEEGARRVYTEILNDLGHHRLLTSVLKDELEKKAEVWESKGILDIAAYFRAQKESLTAPADQ